MKNLIIHHEQDLSLIQIMAVGNHDCTVSLAPETSALLDKRRHQIEQYLEEQEVPSYGFNRGFGHNVDLAVNPNDLKQLQEKLILSHSVGVGVYADEVIVRITMLLRAKSLAKGFSGIRSQLVEKILEFLNKNIIPCVPEIGSVGASGDLAPLSHIALTLMGKGKVKYKNEIMDTQTALDQANVLPIELQTKEGLGLNNGVQYMNAIGLFACHQLRIMLKTECVHTSMVAQVMLASDVPFRQDYHAIRPHKGAIKVAGWIWDLMKNSPIRNVHRNYDIDGQIQDPYNLRCAGQILGSCSDLIDEAEQALLIEANSATDNPVLLPLKEDVDQGKPAQYVDIISGGHFHGMPVAVKIYGLFQALAIMSNLAHQRSVRFVDQSKNNGLGRDLKWPDLSEDEQAISSGMMMLEYTSASLVNDIWGSCTPSHLFNISTNSGQEDHVSMGTSLAVRLLKTLPKAVNIQAIELAYINQAIAIRKSLEYIPSQIPVSKALSEDILALQKKYLQNNIGFEITAHQQYHITEEEKHFCPITENVFESVQPIFPIVKSDRYMAEEIEALSKWLTEGKLLEIAEQYVTMTD